MAIEDAARAAVWFWRYADAVLHVAIAGAESGWNPWAKGDTREALIWWWTNREGMSYAEAAALWEREYAPYACEGATSFGLYQINTRWNRDELRRRTGSNNPCAWAWWLFNAWNNTEFAAKLPYTAWTTYRIGSYKQYLEQARIAVERAFREQHPLEPGAIYVIKEGDTLVEIASRLWGDSSRWPEIYEANKSAIGPDPNRLPVGVAIVMPGAPVAAPPPPPPPPPAPPPAAPPAPAPPPSPPPAPPAAPPGEVADYVSKEQITKSLQGMAEELLKIARVIARWEVD